MRRRNRGKLRRDRGLGILARKHHRSQHHDCRIRRKDRKAMLAGEKGKGYPAKVFHAGICITELEGRAGEMCGCDQVAREDGGGMRAM